MLTNYYSTKWTNNKINNEGDHIYIVDSFVLDT